jgi:hypothetical protein
MRVPLLVGGRSRASFSFFLSLSLIYLKKEKKVMKMMMVIFCVVGKNGRQNGPSDYTRFAREKVRRARASLVALFPPPSQTHARTRMHARMADDSSRTEGEAQQQRVVSHLSEAPLVELPKAQSRLRGKDLWTKTSAVVCVLRRPG